MTLRDPLWMQNLSYTAAEDRDAFAALTTAGVVAVPDLKVSQRGAGPNMSVDVAGGAAVITGTDAAGQGNYLCRSDAVTNVGLASSPASGQSRIDLIVATIRDAAVTGSNNDWILQAVTGTASAGTPAVPTLPASSLLLAQVTVNGLVTSILNADIADKRVLAGSPIGVAADLTVPPAIDGQVVGTPAGHVYVAQSGAWVRADTPKVLTASYTLSSVTYGAASWAPWAGSDSLTIAAPGYPVTVRVDHTFTSGKNLGQHRLGLSGDGGATWSYSTGVYASSAGVLDLVPVALSYQVNLSGTGQIKAVAQCNTNNVAGGVAVTPGTYTLTVMPR